MKKVSLFVLAASFTLVACNAPEGDKAVTTETKDVAQATGVEFTVDTTSSLVWTGSKPTGSHTGNLMITNGMLTVTGDAVSAGSFTIDINSLTNHDLSEDDGKSKLIGHLKSPDFFDVEKYPTAKFEITSVAPHTADSTAVLKDANFLISGNLQLKDSTKNVTFPAKITMEGNTLKAAADFNIDRTLWGMNYKGPNNPQDWVISKEVNLKVNLNATKKG